MSDLTKLLLKLSKEGIVVELRPYDTAFDNNINAIYIRLHTSNISNIVTSIVTFTSIESINIDILEYKINELYKELKKNLEKE